MLQMQKRGLSDIVTTVLIILVAIGAISIVWGYLQATVSSGSSELTTACTTLDLQPVSCSYNDSAVFVKYSRNAGAATLTNASLIFQIDGQANTYSATSIPNPLETKLQTLYTVAGTPSQFSIAGTVTTESGKSKICSESYKISCTAGGAYIAPPNNPGNPPAPQCPGSCTYGCVGSTTTCAVCPGSCAYGCVAGSTTCAVCPVSCTNGCIAGSTTCNPSLVQGLNYRVFTGSWGDTHPSNHPQLVALFGAPSALALSNTVNTAQNINWGSSPWAGISDNFVTEYTGYLNIPSTGSYSFFVDGDDAVEIEIDGNVVAYWYNGHGICGGNQVNCPTQGQTEGTVTLTAGYHPFVFRHEEGLGGEGAFAWWKKPTDSSFVIIPSTTYYR
jgi:hypothetical protein